LALNSISLHSARPAGRRCSSSASAATRSRAA